MGVRRRGRPPTDPACRHRKVHLSLSRGDVDYLERRAGMLRAEGRVKGLDRGWSAAVRRIIREARALRHELHSSRLALRALCGMIQEEAPLPLSELADYLTLIDRDIERLIREAEDAGPG